MFIISFIYEIFVIGRVGVVYCNWNIIREYFGVILVFRGIGN